MVNESGQGRGNAGGRPAAGGRKPQASSKGSSKSAAAGWIASRRAKASKRSMPVRILRGALIGFASLFLLAVLAFVVLYMAIDIPKANAQATQSVSVVYYADGKTEMGRFTTTNRDPVAIEKVPEHVQRAFIAAEDRSFYSNRGISPKGIARAFINNFKGEGSGSQGGSTLTQQYVKNYFLTQDKTITRKVKEVVISLKVDQEMSKNQILEAYLNNVYFGRGAYGVQAAAKSYFHKDVSKLTPVEGAFLASVVNNPENMDPTVGPNSEKRANARMAYTLNGMVSMGWLSEAERSKATMPTFYKREPVKYADGPEGYVVASVRQELSRKLKLSTTDIDRGGLRITTTIDKRTQDAAVRAVKAHTPVALQGKLHTGLVAEKANNGAVVAMYGGADYDPVKAPYSDADRSMLQSASTMKIYAAIAALRDGKTIDTRYNGNNYMRLGPNSFVQNDHNKSYGFQPITNMLAYSINTAFVRLNQDIGPEKTLKAAQDSGMPKTLGGMNDTKEILNVLGTGDSRVVDQATGYNTLNSGGKRYDRYLISKVRTYDESYSYDVKVEGEQAYDKGIADDVTWALGKTGVYGTAAGTQYQLNRPLAAKTGTATGNKYIWFNGFTPGQLTTSVGMYYSEDGRTAKSMQNLPGIPSADVYGAGLPRKVWVDFMKAALQGQEVTKLPERSYYNQNKPQTQDPLPSSTYVPPSTAPTPYPERSTSSTSSPSPETSDSPESSSSSSSKLPSSSSSSPSRSSSTSSPRPSTPRPTSSSPPSPTPTPSGSLTSAP